MMKNVLLSILVLIGASAAHAQTSDPWAGYETRDIRQLHNQAAERRDRLKELAREHHAQRQLVSYSLGSPKAVHTPAPQVDVVPTARITALETSPRPVPRPVPVIISAPWTGPVLNLTDDDRIALMTKFPSPQAELEFGPEITFDDLRLSTSSRPEIRPARKARSHGLHLTSDAQTRALARSRITHIPHQRAQLNPFRFVSMNQGYAVPSAGLRAEVNVSRQRMVLKDGGRVIAEWPVSTGRPGYESTRGEFKVSFLSRNHKSSQYNNAPMPCSVFYHNGEAFHGTNAVNQLGSKASHGCVRLETVNACALYDMVRERGKESLTVAVFD